MAHGQEVDALGDREEHDRIRNIVVLGVNTFGWTFKVRNEAPPEPMPYVELVAPSGEFGPVEILKRTTLFAGMLSSLHGLLLKLAIMPTTP